MVDLKKMEREEYEAKVKELRQRWIDEGFNPYEFDRFYEEIQTAKKRGDNPVISYIGESGLSGLGLIGLPIPHPPAAIEIRSALVTLELIRCYGFKIIY